MLYAYRLIPAGLLLCVGLWAGCGTPDAPDRMIETPLERTNYDQWTTHSQVASFTEELAARSDVITHEIMGTSVEGREIPYLKVSSGEFGENRDDKLVVLIFGQQHGNEPSGNDAVLAMLRDFAEGYRHDLLDHMDILFVPQVNPDGAEVPQRRNAENVDLNRSHLILDGEEVRHLRELFHIWEPEVTVDVHQYQPWTSSWIDHGYIRLFDEQYGLPTNVNVPEPIRDLGEEEFLPYVDTYLEEKGYTFHNYLVGDPDQIRYSTSSINDGRQGLAILNTFSLILEGRRAREHNENIPHRKQGQIAALEGLLEFSRNYKDELMERVRSSREQVRQGEVEQFILTMGREQTGEPLTIPVLEVHEDEDGNYREGDTITVDIDNYYPRVVPERATTMPEGYIVPSDEQELITLLHDHRVEMQELTGGETYQVEVFTITDFVEEVFESPTMIPEGSFSHTEYQAGEGDVYVPVDQLRGLMVATALEPQSMHGYIQYDRFEHLKTTGEFPIVRVLSETE